jgi:bifunctional DNase/RNase
MTVAREPAAGTGAGPEVDGEADLVAAQDFDLDLGLDVVEDDGPQTAPESAPEPAWCRLSFALVEVNLPDTNPVVVLQEADLPYRQLRITIGQNEGVAIAYAWRGIATPKPLTHELFADMMRSFGLTLEVVRITEVRGASYSAELVINGRPGQRVLPCRPSDAIALALRQPIAVPIVCEASVMEQAATPPQ